MSDAHAAAVGEPWTPLSCEYLFYQAKQRDKTPAHRGTTVRAIRSALEHDGQPVESDWPYLPALPKALKKWKPPRKIGALFRRKSRPNGTAFDEIWDTIEAGTPVLLCMTLSDAFFRPKEDGVIDADEPVDASLRHAVVALAIGNNEDERLVLVRNSWGVTWGLAGHAWISERYMIPRIKVALTVP